MASAMKAQIKARMIELTNRKGGHWDLVWTAYGVTVRFTQTGKTPAAIRETTIWGEETYNAYVFLTQAGRSIILGVSAAPWVARRDRDIPLWLAWAILEDPVLGLDWPRQLRMKDARRAEAQRKQAERDAQNLMAGLSPVSRFKGLDPVCAIPACGCSGKAHP